MATVAEVLGVDEVTGETVESIDHIEAHPANRLLFFFKDGGQLEYIWKDHSRKDSWSAEMRKNAGERTRAMHANRRNAEKPAKLTQIDEKEAKA